MPAKIELKLANSAKEWNKLVEKSSYGTIFHRWEWLKIVEKHTKSKLYPVIGYKNETPVGIYPFYYQKKKLVKFIFSPPPKSLLMYMGPAVIDSNNFLKQDKRELRLIELHKATYEFMKSLGYDYIRIRTSPGLIDARPFLWTGFCVEPLYTYVINLDRSIKHIWENLNKELRRNINKAKKSGVIIEEGSREELYLLDELLKKRFIEQGVSLKYRDYKRYLGDLYNEFYPQSLRIFVAKYDGEIVTGQIITCYKDKISLWAGSPKTNLLRGTPTELLQWEIIRWAHENGFKYCEIMAGDDPRLRHFKAKFNPELVVWFSATKCSPKYMILEKVAKLIHYGKRAGEPNERSS